ncbi:hypothetical protein IFM89_018393 [Coptis chinensis]|uniref:HTH OST-type domain-containing protein n=1 Tax=Coptis chinensis TaxID=261450 RepID=A0A835LMP0_9MAGN|nr:hypothetical protein IFM89_018393 [Coptis chinensis]
MNSIASKTISFRSSSSTTSLYSHFFLFYSTSTKRTTNSHSFSSSSSSSSDEYNRNVCNDEQNRNVKVSVWWDFENCNVPCGVNAMKVAQRITSALRVNGIKGPVSITAFGDFIQLSRNTQEILSLTGVSLNHVPRGGKNSADRALLADLVFWVSQNPPPAHLFIISGDTDFANILHRLRMNNYNILLASGESAPGVLCSAASIMWHWNHLVRGENYNGKHFNQPPDGPWESWYGQYKGPLEDLFPETGQPACVQAEHSSDATTDAKIRPIPTATVNRIRQVVSLYPKGILITELRSELMKNKVQMDKDFFGHKKFSHLLRSIPNVLKLDMAEEGQILVHGIQPKLAENVNLPKDLKPVNQLKVAEPVDRQTVVEPVDQLKVAEPIDPQKVVRPVDRQTVVVPIDQLKVAEPIDRQKVVRPVDQPKVEPVDGQKVVGPVDQPKVAKPVNSKLRQSTGLEANDSGRSKMVTAELKGKKCVSRTDVKEKSSSPAHAPTTEAPPPVDHKENDVDLKEVDSNPTEQSDSIPKVGLFRRMWRTFFGRNVDSSVKDTTSPELCSASADNVEKGESEEKSVSRLDSLSNINKSVSTEKDITDSEGRNKSSRRVGMFGRTVNWWRSGKSKANPDNTSEQGGEELNQTNNKTDNSELFSKVSFWENMQLFLHTPKGAALISQSKTREQLAQQLQKVYAPHLNTLSIDDLNHLIDVIISEKKWVEENISRTFPFALIHPLSTSTSASKPHISNGLSSLFSSDLSNSNLQRSVNHGSGNGNKVYSWTVAGSNERNKVACGKSKSEILADCQKLVLETLKNQPAGFGMSCFKAMFLEKYGYALDYQKLGYPKLSGLLETIPGIAVEFNFVLSSAKSSKAVIPKSVWENDGAKKASDSDSDSAWKDNDPDSAWKELGPISKPKNCMRSENNAETKEGKENLDFDDNSYLSDEFSDSDGESPVRDGLDGKRVTRKSEEDSSLLQLLDSWHKDDNGKKSRLDDSDDLVDSCRNKSKLSSEVWVDKTREILIGGRRKKPSKTFSFIPDEVGPVVDDKGKLLNNILGSLNNSSDSKIQT